MRVKIRNQEWQCEPGSDGRYTHEQAQLGVLMDIREELRKLNATFACKNAQAIPDLLRRIAANTARKRPRKAVRR